LLQPTAQLTSRAGGERNRENGRGVVNAGGYPVRDPIRDSAGLAGAGSGDHGDRSGQRGRDLPLLRVKIIQQRVG